MLLNGLKNNVFLKKAPVLLLLLAIFCCITGPPVGAESKQQRIQEYKKRQQNLEQQQRSTRAKIQQIKRKEYKALQVLRNNQYRLESAKSTLQDQQYRLSLATSQLDKLQVNLVNLNEDQIKLKGEAGKRLKQIYQGERLSLLHMLTGVRDITTFLDRIYYQQRMVQRDKEVLNQLQEKTQELMLVRNNLNTQKETIVSTINSIANQKKEIAIAVNVNKELVNRLKTDRQAYEASERQLQRDSDSIAKSIRSLTGAGKSAVSYTTGAFLKPVYGAISSPYGWRRHPIFKSRKFHTGVDIAGKNRSPIKAANSGKVIYTGWYGGYGKVVIIDHGKSLSTLYAHMSSIKAHKGQTIKKGEVVGYEGTTGYSTGPHLHFEVRVNGKHTNPMSYIR